MRRFISLILAVVASMELPGQEPGEAPGPPSSYAVAFYSSTGGLTDTARLMVFPIRAAAVAIVLPLELYRLAYSADGMALYGGGRVPEAPTQSQLYRVEFNPLQAIPLTGSQGLSPSAALAVSSSGDRVLVSGLYRHAGKLECGVFELSVPQGKCRTILATTDCNYASTWHSLSFSPDGRQAISIRKGRLELIDLAGLSSRPVGDGYLKVAWSPDGKWIAAVENGAKWRTMLLDTKEFRIRKVLDTTEAEWSPDSRYLLAGQPHPICESDYGTLDAIDIESGKRFTFESSKCKVNQTTSGWVSSSIMP